MDASLLDVMRVEGWPHAAAAAIPPPPPSRRHRHRRRAPPRAAIARSRGSPPPRAGAPLAEPVLAAIACPVLHGLRYLHRERHTIHRDIKPSNLLVDASGKIKIADFGVSGELGDTLAKAATWVGTVHYMSPERILGGAYAYDSDVWSFGITILELATLRFPYPPAPPAAPQQRLGFWDLLDCIVESPPPAPPATASAPLASLVTACLQKQPAARASSSALLQHPFVAAHAARPLDAGAWARGVLAKLPADGPRPPDGAPPAPDAPARGRPAAAAQQQRGGEAMDEG